MNSYPINGTDLKLNEQYPMKYNNPNQFDFDSLVKQKLK